MTITTFQRKCTPGTAVFNASSGEKGIVQKISKENDKALVLYEDGDKAWRPYFAIELDKPQQQ